MERKELTARLRRLSGVKSARITGTNSIRIETPLGSSETVSDREAERILAYWEAREEYANVSLTLSLSELGDLLTALDYTIEDMAYRLGRGVDYNDVEAEAVQEQIAAYTALSEKLGGHYPRV